MEMNEYRTTGIIEIPCGTIGLNLKQAEKRKLFIEKTKVDGVYNILKPIIFKAGEIIRLASISKGQNRLLDDVSEPEPNVSDPGPDDEELPTPEPEDSQDQEPDTKRTRGRKKKAQ